MIKSIFMIKKIYTRNKANLALVIAVLCSVVNAAKAHEYQQGSMQIDHPWSREAPETVKVIAGYFQLTNQSSHDDFLLSASTPIAETVEIHRHVMLEGMMKMEKVEQVRIGSFKRVMFEPASYHLMIFNPTKHFKKGERFPMTLTFKNAGDVEVDIAIEESGHQHTH